jgi:hypothetical protein
MASIRKVVCISYDTGKTVTRNGKTYPDSRSTGRGCRLVAPALRRLVAIRIGCRPPADVQVCTRPFLQPVGFSGLISP